MTGVVPICTAPGCSEQSRARRLCGKHYQAAWKAGELRRHKKLPPRPAAQICPPDHKHAGSLVCYNLHRCRCTPCSEHRTAAETRRRKDKAYGRYDTGLVDVAPVREHMLALLEFGIGYKRIAMLAGVGVTSARNILFGRQDPERRGEMLKRVRRETAEAILTVRPVIENLAPGAMVPALGTHRRLQALIVAGWSLSKLAVRLEFSPSNFGIMLHRDRIRLSTHLAVRALFDELWDQEPPHAEWRDLIAYNRARSYARARRWLPALAWDDPDTDTDPPAVDDNNDDLIDETAVVLALAGERPRLTPAERRECVRRLHPLRWSDGRIAETIGCAENTVLRIRDELDLPAFDQNDLVHRGAAA